MRLIHLFLLMLLNLSASPQSGNLLPVKIVANETASKIDIYIGDKYFTSYMYSPIYEKPFLYPIAASNGTLITRGFPINTRPGERVDHPHQVGMWFTYGDVNGLDFWNNSYAIPESEKKKYGKIIHRKISTLSSGTNAGKLTVELEWVDYLGKVLLKEETTFSFSGNITERYIERTSKLTAVADKVVFGDNKEGLMGLRVDRAFESPSTQPLIFSDANGKPTKVALMDNTGVNGLYKCSSDFQGDSVWGKRNKWVSLTANLKGTDISIVVFDHHLNIGYPAHAHARGYGLFAINNFGNHVFNPAEAVSSFELKGSNATTMKYLFVIKCGSELTKDEADKIAVEFDNKPE